MDTMLAVLYSNFHALKKRKCDGGSLINIPTYRQFWVTEKPAIFTFTSLFANTVSVMSISVRQSLIVSTPPNIEDYTRLRADTGLSLKAVEAARIGLRNTWFGVHVVHGGETVGMGRIIVTAGFWQ